MMTAKMAGPESSEDIRKVYDMIDTDGLGKITFQALKKVLKDLGENLNDDEIQSMLEHADKSNKGGVTPQDFEKLMRKKSQASAVDMIDDD